MKLPTNIVRQNYCMMSSALPARVIRSRFLDYFVNEKQHQFVKSYPIMSYFDRNTPFVNSGSCQFKNVFTGEDEVECDKAVNSQKCARIVGFNCEAYYTWPASCQHAFFEMLGSWSFGAYNMKETCELAWKLLTAAPYSIPPNKLFVTYFGGDDNLQLPCDEETRDIWRQIGVPPNQITSLGLEHNFWESGPVGPCGPSTKIKVILTESVSSENEYRSQGKPALVELWHIAVIKYNKNGNLITKLPTEYINTGMGLERLTALLQGKTSSYDTDLFTPLFDTISQVTKAPIYQGISDPYELNRSYRSLADLSRLITVAIADNVFPDLNSVLKRTFRTLFSIITLDFNYQNPTHLLHELSSLIAEEFHETFPEVGNNLLQVKLITENEFKIIKNVCDKNEIRWNIIKKKYPKLQELSVAKYPDLPFAVEYLTEILSTSTGDTLSPQLFHNICQIFSLDRSVMRILSKELRFKISWKKIKEFSTQKSDADEVLRLASFQQNELSRIIEKKTDFSAKYEYLRTDDGAYQFPPTNAKLVAILAQNEPLSIISPKGIAISEALNSKIDAEVEIPDKEINFIFDKTNFIATKNETGCDKGDIFLMSRNDNISFEVKKATILQDFVIHSVRVSDKKFIGKKIKAGADAMLHVYEDRRLNLMRNSLMAHLVKAAMKEIFPVFYFKGEIVMVGYVRFTVRVLGQEVTLADKTAIEEKLRNFIAQKLSVQERMVSSGRKLLSMPSLNLLPSQQYPSSNLRVMTIEDKNGKIISNEACDAVHVSNVADVTDFKITKWKTRQSSDLDVTIVTGDQAKTTFKIEEILRNDVPKFENISAYLLSKKSAATLAEVINGHEELRLYVYKTLYMLRQKNVSSDYIHDCITTLKTLLIKHKKKLDDVPRESVVIEVTSKIRQKTNNQKFSVYCCLFDYKWFRHRSFRVDMTYCHNFPIFFFHWDDDHVHGMSYVPEACMTKNFNAEVWMQLVAEKQRLQIREEPDLDKYCFARKLCFEHQIYPHVDPILKTAHQVAEKYIK